MGYSLLLLAHVIGLVLFAGTTIINFALTTSFWKSVRGDLPRAKIIFGLSGRLSRFTGIGGLLLILSGIAMVASTHGVIAAALWFKVKITLVIVMIVVGMAGGRVLTGRLVKAIGSNEATSILALKPSYQIFYWFQVLLLAGIVSMGVLKAF